MENEVPEAISFLGDAYCEGWYGLVKSDKKAAKIYRRAVELGDVDAMVNLGLLYETGSGVKLDKKKAMQLYRNASNRGSAKGQKYLGFMYAEDGKYDEGVPFLKMSVEAGFAEGMGLLGLCYDYGNGVERDLDEAKRLYSLAVAKGYEPAGRILAEREKEGWTQPPLGRSMF